MWGSVFFWDRTLLGGSSPTSADYRPCVSFFVVGNRELKLPSSLLVNLFLNCKHPFEPMGNTDLHIGVHSNLKLAVGSTWLLWRPQLVACAGIGATNSTNLSA
jgi:hypothetical protein